MLPTTPLEFDEFGNLPAGDWPVTRTQLLDRFCSGTPERQRLRPFVAGLLELAGQFGATSVIFGGSFISPKPDPADVDFLIVFFRPIPRSETVTINAAIRALAERTRVPCHYNLISRAYGVEYRRVHRVFLCYDRQARPRGRLEVLLNDVEE